MKINERHLVMFVNGSAAIDKQGFLHKRGEVNKSFQRRWFVLKGNLLFYFDKRGDSEPVGVIILEGCSVELAEDADRSSNTDKYSFELTFLGSGARTYVLAADSQEEMEDWMQVLACAGYDYMKCAVEELQKQLDELNAANHRIHDKVPIRSASSRKARHLRTNPFNLMDSSEQDAPEIISAVVDQPQSEKRVRTFKEMHDEFGQYILLRVNECRKELLPELN